MKNNYKYLYLAIAFISLAICFAGLVALSQSPYTGLHFAQHKGQNDNKWYISAIDRDSPAAMYPELSGREVIGINGWEIGAQDLNLNPSTIFNQGAFNRAWEFHRYQADKLVPGSILSIQVKDNELTKTFKIPLIRYKYTLQNIFNIGAILLTVIIMLSIALIPIFKANNEVNRTFFLCILSIVFVIIPYSNYLNMNIAYPYMVMLNLATLKHLASMFMLVTLLHFGYIFPYRLSAGRYRPVIAGFYLLPSGIFIGSIIWGYSLNNAIVMSSLLAMIIYAVTTTYMYFKYLNPIQKAQVKWMVFSIVICIIVYLIYVIPLSMGMEQIIPDIFLILLLNIVPLSIAFSILKYRLMDIDTLLDNTLIYTVTIGVLGAIDLTIVSVLTNVGILNLRISQPLAIIISLWIVIFTYIPIREFTKKQIKKLLKREQYDPNQLVITFQKELLVAQESNEVINVLFRTIANAVHPQKLEFAGLNDTIPDESEGGLLLPMKGLHENIGTVVLYQKHSGNLYSVDDRKLIESLCDTASIVIESIRTREKAITEKQEIAREIHDNIGHSLIIAKYMATETNPERSNKGKELENILDNGLQELRDVLSLADGEKQILGDFIENIYKKSEYFKYNDKIKLDIEIDSNDETIELPYQVRSNLTKIIQEAISNAIKYSGGDHIRIGIEQTGNELNISVSDNGKGFDTSKDMPTKHHGLRNMARRAEAIGAEFSITSGHDYSGKGVRVAVRVQV